MKIRWPINPWSIFFVVAFAYLLAYFNRLSPAVIAIELKENLHTNDVGLGLLAAFDLYIYALMQIPAGFLIDYWGPRKTVTLFNTIGAFGAFLLAISPNLIIAQIARCLTGLGFSATLLAALTLIARWMPIKKYQQASGFLLAAGGIGCLMATRPLEIMASAIGWRLSYVVFGSIALITSGLVWLLVRDYPPTAEGVISQNKKKFDFKDIFKDLYIIVKNPMFWAISLFGQGTLNMAGAYCGLWGGPFLREAMNFSAANAASILLFGALGIITGPSLGLLLIKKGWVKEPISVMIFGGALITAFLCFFNLNILPPIKWLLCIHTYFFCVASTISAPLSFGYLREYFPFRLMGTVNGFYNLFCIMGAGLYQTFVGVALNSALSKNMDIQSSYAYAFWPMTLGAFIACLCSYVVKFLLETKWVVRNEN